MADIYSLSIRADTRDVTRAKQALDGLASGSVKAQRATQQLELATQRTVRRGFTPMRGAIQQAGFQIGDFAVQVGAGQNALVAFAQQGSQLAGIFGPGGAVIGAIIAIGGALAGGLVRSFGSAEESTEDLTESTKELVRQLGEATRLQREFINAQFQQSIQEQNHAITDAEAAIRSVNARLEDFRRAVGENVPDAVFNSNSAVKSLRKELTDAGLTIDNANSAIEAITQQQEQFWKEVEETSTKLEDGEEKLANFVAGIQAQADTIGLSARQTALYEAARLGANEADIQAINNAFDLIEAERQRMNLQKAMQASGTVKPKDDPMLQRIEAERRGQEILLQQQEDYTEARERLDGNMLSSATSTASALANTVGQMAGEQSAAYQAAFVAQQAFAIASAIVNTQMAAAAALAPPPIGLGPVAGAPYAAFVEGLGAANVAIIAAQTLTGLAEAQTGARQMGGSVSAGGRYLVGESGPEIVTMGGSGVVTPSSVTNRGGDTNITQVLQVPGNIQQEVKQQIMAALPLIRSTAINAVSTEINRGGNMARQVGRRS